MANSYVAYEGDGADDTWTVTFPYIQRAHVDVYLDGVETSAYSWNSDTEILFDTAPGDGVRILIQRNTSQTERLVDYEVGKITEETLDNDSLQAFYMAQEAIDTANDALTLDSSDSKFDADSKVIKNVANGVADNDAVNKSQLDAAEVAAGNVTTPEDPGDDGKFLKAGGGAWDWVDITIADVSDGATTGKALLADETAADARTTLGLASGATTTVGTAAEEDVGTNTGDVVQLEDVGGSPGLPAVDGSQLTGLPVLTEGTACVLSPFSINSQTTQAHGLGAVPTFCVTELECLSDEHGYSTGDIVEPAIAVTSGSSTGATIFKDATNTILTISNNSTPSVASKDDNTLQQITAANWLMRVRPFLLN